MEIYRKWFAPALTVLLFVACLLLVSVTFGFVFKNDTYLWTMNAIGVIVVVFTFITWLPTGIDKGKLDNSYTLNNKIYSARVNYIGDNQLYDKLASFCDYSNDKKEKELITAKLGTVGLNYNSWIKYKDDRLNSVLEGNTLTKKQSRVLNNIFNNGVKFKHRKSENISQGERASNDLVPRNKQYSFVTFKLVTKVVWGICTGCFMTMIILQPTAFGIEQAVKLVVWAFSILFNIFSGINTGFDSIATHRKNYIIKQADICSQFFEYCEIDVKQVDGNIKE